MSGCRVACCALISQCISQALSLPRTLIINMLCLPSAACHLSFYNRISVVRHNRCCGLRAAGGPGQKGRQARSVCGKRSCEAEHMLSLFLWLLLMAPRTTRALSIPMAKGIFNSYAYLLCAGHVPRQQFASRRLCLHYLSQSHFAACCSIANNIN